MADKLKIGLLLVNLGTPAAPTAPAVRQFLKAFLSDPLVVRIPRIIWLPLLWCFILPLRSKRVAKLYEKIWWKEGSPLKVITERQCLKLQDVVNREGIWAQYESDVAYAMVYGEPDIAGQLAKWIDDGYQKVIVLPLYPQYSSATTASVQQQVQDFQEKTSEALDISIIEEYHQDEAYIHALADSVKEFWQKQEKGERLLMSFHGLPQKLVDLGDPYYAQCQKTAHELAKLLNLDEEEWSIGFQSRFGPAEWIKPYSDEVIKEWAEQGLKTIDVIAPAFSSDCLETLEEIAVQYAEEFIASGGKKLSMIPCLNDDNKHIQMMEKLFIGALNSKK